MAKLIVSLLVLVVSACISAVVAGGGREKHEFKCNNEKAQLPELRKMIMECHDNIEETDKCRWVHMKECIYRKNGIIKEDNKFNRDNFIKATQRIFKDNGQKLGEVVFNACLADDNVNVQKLSGTAKDDCTPFKKVFTCTAMETHKYCNDDETEL